MLSCSRLFSQTRGGSVTIEPRLRTLQELRRPQGLLAPGGPPDVCMSNSSSHSCPPFLFFSPEKGRKGEEGGKSEEAPNAFGSASSFRRRSCSAGPFQECRVAFIPDEGDAMGLGNFPRYALWEEGRDVPAWSLGGRARDLPCEESGVSWSLELPAPPQSDGKSGGSRKRDILGEPKEKGEPTPPAGDVPICGGGVPELGEAAPSTTGRKRKRCHREGCSLFLDEDGRDHLGLCNVTLPHSRRQKRPPQVSNSGPGPGLVTLFF